MVHQRFWRLQKLTLNLEPEIAKVSKTEGISLDDFYRVVHPFHHAVGEATCEKIEYDLEKGFEEASLISRQGKLSNNSMVLDFNMWAVFDSS